MGTASWTRDYRKGLRLLSGRREVEAARALREAAELCPASRRRDLARILYFLAIALERAGSGALALRSLADARRLDRRGHAREIHRRWANEYGMRRQRDAAGDDYCAFFSVQMARYLSKRGNGRFGSQAERDAVGDLITDAWRRLAASGIFAGMPAERKLEFFRRAKVDLPFLYLEDAFEESRAPVVVDFIRERRVAADDRCPCGSGLPYRSCCGRVPSSCEFDPGSL